MICRMCATAADMRTAWLTNPEPNKDIYGWTLDAAVELHSQCPGKTSCDCQHKVTRDRFKNRAIGLLIAVYSDVPDRPRYPARCGVCYRRTALTRVGGVIHWHKNPPERVTNMYGHQSSVTRSYGVCPGSGKPDLAKAIAGTVTS